MAKTVQETKRTTTTREGFTDNTTVTSHPGEFVARIVYFIGGVILSLLALRFLLSMLGANRDNVFADFIYSTTYPLATPFFGLFNYDVSYGQSRFEFETLVAIVVYGLVVWGIVWLLTFWRRPID